MKFSVPRLSLLTITLLSMMMMASADVSNHMRVLGSPHGLSDNYVVSVAGDKRGIIWIATENGLNIFDGNRFVNIYKKGDGLHDAIGGNELNTLYDDPRDSVMWIGTQRSGLDAYDYAKGEFIHYRHDEADSKSLITDDITKISSTSEGDILVATYWRGVDVLDKRTGIFTHYNSDNVKNMPPANVWTVADAGNGDYMYVGHVDGGMTVVSRKSRTAVNYRHDPGDPMSIPSDCVRAIVPYSSREIFVGTDVGLAVFNTETRSFRMLRDCEIEGKCIYDITMLRGGRMAVATEFDGLFIIDLSNGLLHPGRECRRIVGGKNSYGSGSLSIRTSYEDNYGNLWVGTYGHGLDCITPDDESACLLLCGESRFGDKDVSGIIVRCVAVDDQGMIWTGTDGDGVKIFDGSALYRSFPKIADDDATVCLNAVYSDKYGNMWFGSYEGGVIYRNGLTGSFQRLGEDRNLDVRSFYEYRDTIYAVTTHGVYAFDIHSGKQTGHWDIVGARDMAVDSDGKIWIATFGDGLGVYSSEWKELRYFKMVYGFPSNAVNDVFKDSKNRMWVATRDGLVCFSDTDSFDYELYNMDTGLTNNYISSVVEDNDGNIWVATKKGINAITGAGVLSFIKSKGYALSSFADRGIAVNPDGMLYLASDNGLFSLNPRNILKSRNLSPVRITSFDAYDSEGNELDLSEMGVVDTGRKYRLRHNCNSIAFSFGVSNYAETDLAEYSFKLEGFDKDWFENGSNMVSYRNLPPGKYVMRVRTRFRNQEWKESDSSVVFEICPPIWLAWWARLLYVVCALTVILFILSVYRKRVKAESMYLIERKNRIQSQELTDERLRFYTNITHELRTPLTLIVSPLDDVLHKSDLSSSDRHRLTVIHRNARNLLNLVNQILDFRKTETHNKRLCIRTENIVPVVYETVLKYKELATDPNIRMEMSAPDESIVIPFDREVVKMILDNLISNAIKYTAKGVIRVSCDAGVGDAGEKTVVLSVADTGYGIGEEALPHIFSRYYQEKTVHQASGTGIGLSLVKNLVDLHHGSIVVSSKVNEGSVFTVTIPAEFPYPEALHPDDDASLHIVAHQDKQDKGQEDLRKRPLVLVVEDNKDLCDYISDCFVDLYDVKTAHDGAEGLDMARAFMPDIIITDVMMPVMDGVEMCAKIKNDIATSHIPVIMLTAKITEADRESGYAAGANSYLTKPFSSQLLISRVNNLLRERERNAEKILKNINMLPHETTPQADDSPTQTECVIPENALDRQFLDKLRNCILDHMSTEQVDIPFIADALCVSKATLYRKVKALTGVSPNEYIRKTRLQVAEKLLIEGNLTVSDIAFRVGFNSTPYFRQCFKEEFGLTPSEYVSKSRSVVSS